MNKMIIKIFFVLILLGMFGCAGSPNNIKTLDNVQIKQVTDADLCNAYSAGREFHTQIIKEEIQRRGVNCNYEMEKIKKRRNAHIPDAADLTYGACEGIELMGVYNTNAHVGLKAFFVKVRNHGTVARGVTVWFIPKASSGLVRSTGNYKEQKNGREIYLTVNPGMIAEGQLGVSDRNPQNVRIIGCE